jgi:hypothetical protein
MLSSETVKNLPLTGPELKELILARMREALDREWMFLPGTSYPRVAWSAEVTIQTANPRAGGTVAVRARREKSVEGPPPLAGDPESGVVAFSVGETVENPNLTRVGMGMPIAVTRVEKDGKSPFGRVVSETVKYAKEDYPELPPAKVTRREKEAAAKIGGKVTYSADDPEDLDATGTEEEAAK